MESLSITISVSAILVVIGAMSMGIWKLSAWKHKLDDLENVRKNSEGLISLIDSVKTIESNAKAMESNIKIVENNVKVIENNVKTIENNVKVMEGEFKTVKDKVETIYNLLTSREGQSFSVSTSPLSLTDYGKETATRIKADEIVSLFEKELYQNVKEKSLNAYQVQEYCFDFAENKMLGELEKKARSHFDNIGAVAFEKGVDIKDIMRNVIGILLRDELLQSLKITNGEADKRAPSQE